MASRILTALIALAAALPTSAHPSGCSKSKAIYVTSNSANNSVVALPIGSNGLLSLGTSTSTGGSGSASVDSAGNPAGPDALLSQSALTVAGRHIFTVNAGSNTVSMLAIDRADPTKLTMVGQPAAAPGTFPNTVAASMRHRMVCVGLSGATAGVSCASFSARTGIGAFDTLRPFALNQTTPPAGPPNTVSQVLFSADESMLFALVKGVPMTNNTGFVATYAVGSRRSGVSHNGTMSSPAGTALLFGAQIVPGTGNIAVSDPSFGSAVLSVNAATGVVSTAAAGTIANQTAICWVAVSPATGTTFLADVAKSRLVEVSASNASIISITDLSANGDPGLTDLQAAGNFVYALSPGNDTVPTAITVLDAVKKTQVQHLDISSLGLSKTAQGMAVL